MATAPAYAATPLCSCAVIATANAALDGTGTLSTIVTAGVNGSRIDRVRIKATGPTTAGMVRVFLHDGTATTLYTEVPIAAVTPSANTPAHESDVTFPGGLILPANYSLLASTHQAETFVVTAQGGSL